MEMKIINYVEFPMYLSSFPPVLVHGSVIPIKATFISTCIGGTGPAD